ncbi:MAG: hypothetical protein RMJ19_08180 [Gemmatales bacterium]|nr:hypothetical protein [Gemmatales bacterium]MDW8175635.1 hypothetical protein [Gemmatales bacterium]
MSEPSPLSEQEREELIAYLDGELDTQAARAVEEKLQRDPAWRREAEQLQATWEMLDFLPQAHAPASFTERTLTVLQASQARQLRYRRLRRNLVYTAWAAAVILSALTGFWSGRGHPVFPSAEPPWPPSEEVLLLLQHREYWPYYDKLSSFSFLRQLDQADLFEEGS